MIERWWRNQFDWCVKLVVFEKKNLLENNPKFFDEQIW